MIPKGNQRGGGRQLATHLLNAFDNERVELLELRGSVAKDLHGAFHEWYAQSKATKASKYLYSLSVSPDLAKYDLNREQYLDFIARTERSLKLVGQPRAVVFHVKNGREHAHVVWSRIDVEAGKAVPISHDRLKLRAVVQEFARDHGLPLPEGMRKNGRKERFDEQAKQSNLAEKQQEERSGLSKEERMAVIREAWESGDPRRFFNALEEKGLFLARGDSGRYVVVDLAGEIHSLYRQIEGMRTKEIKDFLAADYPLDKLPDAESARAWAKAQRELRQAQQKHDPPEIRQKQEEMLARQTAARREALDRQQQERRAPLIEERDKMQARHAGQREALAELHVSENRGILSARAFRQPQGLRAFLIRVTGFQMLIGLKHRREDSIRAAAQKQQSEALQSRHARERQELDRRDTNLAALEAKEKHSLETALGREEFQRTYGPERDIRPEFERASASVEARQTGDTGTVQKDQLKQEFTAAADPQTVRENAGDTSREDKPPATEKAEEARKGDLAALFNRISRPFRGEKGDARKAFERAADPDPLRFDTNRPPELDPQRLAQARKAKAELERRERGRGQGRRDEPGRDRDR